MSAGLDFDDPLTLIVERLREHRAAAARGDDDVRAPERERACVLAAMRRASSRSSTRTRASFRGLEGRRVDRALEEMGAAHEQIAKTSAHMALIAETMEHDPSKVLPLLLRLLLRYYSYSNSYYYCYLYCCCCCCCRCCYYYYYHYYY